MRRPILGMLLSIACMSIVLPTSALATPQVGEKDNGFSKTDERYLAQYVACVHADGCDYGRNLVDDGLSSGKPPTDARIEEAWTVMDRQMHPARYAPAPAPDVASVSSQTTSTAVAPTTSTGVSSGTLDSIAACESGGDPTAVSPDGSYRGKYQFDYGTWASVGGSGDPAAAPEAEQDARAAQLYAQSGSSPWPVCGQ